MRAFGDHTCALFEEHGLTNIGYWVPVDAKDNRLIYVISSPNRACVPGAGIRPAPGFQAQPTR